MEIRGITPMGTVKAVDMCLDVCALMQLLERTASTAGPNQAPKSNTADCSFAGIRNAP